MGASGKASLSCLINHAKLLVLGLLFQPRSSALRKHISRLFYLQKVLAFACDEQLVFIVGNVLADASVLLVGEEEGVGRLWTSYGGVWSTFEEVRTDGERSPMRFVCVCSRANGGRAQSSGG